MGLVQDESMPHPDDTPRMSSLATEMEREAERASREAVSADGAASEPSDERIHHAEVVDRNGTDADVDGQQRLWKPDELGEHEALADEALSRTRHTTDSLFLADVPVAHNQEQALQVFDVNGGGRIPGKVLFTQGPHPTYVVLDKQVIKRADVAPEDRAKTRALMTSVVTTVLYSHGPIQTTHYDVARVLLEMKRQDWLETGSSSTWVTTTKTAIADRLKQDLNGQLSKAITEALTTLQGLSVTKIYRAPELGEIGHGIASDIKESMGSIVINYRIEERAGGTSALGGRRYDIIQVELNAALVRAMTGQLGANERQWLLRSLDFERNLRHRTAWQRQLDSMIDARFDTSGYFQMPLYELWVHRLGKPASDFSKPEKARKVRFMINKTLKEWEKTGFIENLVIAPRNGLKVRLKKDVASVKLTAIDVPIDVKDFKGTLRVDMPAGDSPALNEWVSCEPGHAFWEGLRHKRPQFAREILAATVADAKQREQLLVKYTAEFVIDTAYERLKRICRDLGDRRDRLPVARWLGGEYPQPNRSHQVHMVLVELGRRAEAARVGEQYRTIDAPLYDRRQRAVSERMSVKLERAKLSLADLAERETKPEEADIQELVACYRLAFEHEVKRTGFARAADELLRITNPEVDKAYRLMAEDATKVAIRAGGMIAWYKFVSEQVAKRIPAAGPTKDQLISAAKRFPKAMGLCVEMTQASSGQWEAHVGQLFQRRLVEFWIEDLELEALEQRLRSRGSGRGAP